MTKNNNNNKKTTSQTGLLDLVGRGNVNKDKLGLPSYGTASSSHDIPSEQIEHENHLLKSEIRSLHSVLSTSDVRSHSSARTRRPSMSDNQAKTGVMTRLLGSEKKKHKERKEVPSKIKHSWGYSMLNGKSRQLQARIYQKVITFFILLSVVSFIISTEPAFSIENNPTANQVFDIIDGVTSGVFLIELIFRLYVITESRKFRHPIKGRLSYLISFSGFIDFVSCVPYFAFYKWNNDPNFPSFGFLRIFRLFRILKTEKYAQVLNTVYRVLWFNSEILVTAFLLCIQLLLFTSTLLYYLRPQDESHPDIVLEAFQSIPNTMYLALLMLTGQGQPDGELPWFTKVIVAVTAVFSVAMFAIPASMLTWGFEAEAERLAARAYEKEKKRRKRHLEALERQARASTSRIGDSNINKVVDDLSESSNSSSSSGFSDDSDDEWIEYAKIIAGGEDEDEDGSGGEGGNEGGGGGGGDDDDGDGDGGGGDKYQVVLEKLIEQQNTHRLEMQQQLDQIQETIGQLQKQLTLQNK